MSGAARASCSVRPARVGLFLCLASVATACGGAKPGEIAINAQDPSPPVFVLRVGVAGDAGRALTSPGSTSIVTLRDANSTLVLSATAVDSGSGVQAVQIFVVESRLSCVTPAGTPLQVCVPSTIADSLERPTYDSVVAPLGAGAFVTPASVLTRSLNLMTTYPPLPVGPGDSVRQTLSFFGAAKNHAGKESRSEELRVTWVTRGP